MSGLRFTKWHGAGNDFILLDAFGQSLDATHLSELAQRLCHRPLGIGADGLLVVEPSPQADCRMRLFNADGSEAPMCGNGIRCVARYMFERYLSDAHALCVETGAGIREVSRTADGRYRVAMGTPHFEPTPEGWLVNTGALHLVQFTNALEEFPLAVQGAALQRHPRFPNGVNFTVGHVARADLARARVWERGVGETLACGTGACALVVAGVLTEQLARTATVHMPGGLLQVEWADDGSLWLIGDAVCVFEGVWYG